MIKDDDPDEASILNFLYANEQADILANHILALMGAKTIPPHDSDRLYDNLTEILVLVMKKVRAKVQPMDKYPYTWEMFVENLGLILNDTEGKNE